MITVIVSAGEDSGVEEVGLGAVMWVSARKGATDGCQHLERSCGAEDHAGSHILCT